MPEQRGKFVRVPADLWNDKRLSLAEKGVMISLFWHYNNERRRSWPSQKMISEETGLSAFWVRENLKKLEAKKYIVAEKESGKNTVYAICPLPQHEDPLTELGGNRNSIADTEVKETGTEFPLVVETKNDVTTDVHPGTQFPSNPATQLLRNHETQLRGEQEKKSSQDPATQLPYPATQLLPPRNSVALTPQLSCPELDNIKTNNQTINQTNNAREKSPARRSAAKAFDFESDFEAFWLEYPKPKHPDKTPGRKKYEALRKKGVSADDLLNAAKNYAIAMQGTSPDYIKRCATFLGPQEPWRDYVSMPNPAAESQAAYPDYGDTLPSWDELLGGERN